MGTLTSWPRHRRPYRKLRVCSATPPSEKRDCTSAWEQGVRQNGGGGAKDDGALLWTHRDEIALLKQRAHVQLIDVRAAPLDGRV